MLSKCNRTQVDLSVSNIDRFLFVVNVLTVVLVCSSCVTLVTDEVSDTTLTVGGLLENIAVFVFL